jgi:hypothetical protein
MARVRLQAMIAVFRSGPHNAPLIASFGKVARTREGGQAEALSEEYEGRHMVAAPLRDMHAGANLRLRQVRNHSFCSWKLNHATHCT